MSSMESYYSWIFALLVIAVSLKSYGRIGSNNTKSNSDNKNNDKNTSTDLDSSKELEFTQFQRWYIIIFSCVMLADWMQGPYVYKLYASYNLSREYIAILFVIGFGTSGITGPFMGTLADKFGRRNMCLLFCVLYASSCISKHFNSYLILMIGRVLGGASTSILFSCFESWMVTHHHKQGYDGSKLSSTFEIAWSLNSIIAICAGFITSFAVSYYDKYDIAVPHQVAAFDCSFFVLCIAFFLIAFQWRNKENYGDSQINVYQSLSNSYALITSDSRVILVGCVQSGFESAMYLFVFMWTMALENVYNSSQLESEQQESSQLDHGIIFAVFMEACLCGTTLCGIVDRSKHPSEQMISVSCLVACVALLIVPFTNSYEMRLAMFIIFEVCVGIYFPTIGALRGNYIPDNVRATIMNVFRIPLNCIVVCVLWFIDDLGMQNIFMLSAALLFIAAISAHCLHQTPKAKSSENSVGH